MCVSEMSLLSYLGDFTDISLLPTRENEFVYLLVSVKVFH